MAKPTFEFEGYVNSKRYTTIAASEGQAKRFIAIRARRDFGLQPYAFVDVRDVRKTVVPAMARNQAVTTR